MKLAILSAAHGRHSVFKKFINSIPSDIQKIIVGSDDENRKYFDKNCTGTYIISPNKPLGKKWNFGLQYAKNHDFDYLIIIGSDDIFSSDLWDYYRTLDVHYFGILDIYFLEDKKIKYCPGFMQNRFGEPHGAGRAIHRSVLDACDWKLWDDEINIGLDASMTETLRRFKFESEFIRLTDNGFVALDIKTNENLHSSKEYQGRYLHHEESNWVLKKLGW